NHDVSALEFEAEVMRFFVGKERDQIDAIEEHHAIDGRACVFACGGQHLTVVGETSIDEANHQLGLLLLQDDVALPKGDAYFGERCIYTAAEFFEAFERNDDAI